MSDPTLWSDVPAVVNDLAKEVIGVAIRVHDAMGPGLLEKPYKLVLFDELEASGHDVKMEHPMSIIVNGRPIERAYIADLVVDDILLIEVKSVRHLDANMIAQVKTYLRMSGLPLGLLFNFHERYLYRGGIKRIVP